MLIRKEFLMTDNANRSSPIAQFECPRIQLVGAVPADHVVTLTDAPTFKYTCSCGEVFEWESQTNWRRIAATGDA